MDISYSLLLEDHSRINPLAGIEQLSEKIVPSGMKFQTVPRKEEVAAQNQQSMAVLSGMMGNVQGKKPRVG